MTTKEDPARAVGWHGDDLIAVHLVGACERWEWGFTIWRDGECLEGRSDPRWTFEQAKTAALAAVGVLDYRPQDEEKSNDV